MPTAASRKKRKPAPKHQPAPPPEPPSGVVSRKTNAILLGMYLFAAFYILPIFPHGGSANELTRWATSASLFEKHSFELSWTLDLTGPIIDGAKVGDRIYSNKPPGAAVAGLPAYAAARAVAGPPNASNIRLSWSFLRWMLSSAPLFLLAFFWLKKQASPQFLAILLFGTPLFLYSLLLFSHVLTGVALYFAYRMLFSNAEGPQAKHCLLAGVLCGIAASSEFPAAIPVAIFGIGLLLHRNFSWHQRLASAGYFVLGGLPFVAGLAIYNKAVFGSALSFSYEHESFGEWAEVASHGLFGISWPTPENLWLLMFSPSRGLFFFSPVLLLAAFQLVRWGNRPLFRIKVRAAAVVVTVLAMSGHGAAHGGWAAGPRYLVLILPLLLEPLTELDLGSHPFRNGLLTAISFVLCLLPAFTFPFSPPEYTYAHNTFFRPLIFFESWLSPTVGALIGLGTGWIAWTPMILIVLGTLALCCLASENPKHFALGLFAGAIVVTAYVFAPGLDRPDLQVRRASIAERFFLPANRLQPFKEEARASRDIAAVRQIRSLEWMIADTRAYAPDDWPYAKSNDWNAGPTAAQKQIVEQQQRGNFEGAIALAQKAQQDYPAFQCALASNLSVLYYTSGRKDEALFQLENARNLVLEGADEPCARNLFLLGSLYLEKNQVQQAASAMRDYLEISEGLNDSRTLSNRQSAEEILKAAR